jgi:hypothetical protein
VPRPLLGRLLEAWRAVPSGYLAVAGHPSAPAGTWSRCAFGASAAELATALIQPHVWANPEVQEWLEDDTTPELATALALLCKEVQGVPTFRPAFALLSARDPERAARLLTQLSAPAKGFLEHLDLVPLLEKGSSETRLTAIRNASQVGREAKRAQRRSA